MTGRNLRAIVTDAGLAQLGDALLNFAFSMALTEKNGQPTGTRVLDKTLAEAAVEAGLRQYLPRRVNRGEVANSIEALLGFVWIEKLITLEEVVTCLKAESPRPSTNFAVLASVALARMKK